jgi:TPR repeat protein
MATGQQGAHQMPLCARDAICMLSRPTGQLGTSTLKLSVKRTKLKFGDERPASTKEAVHDQQSAATDPTSCTHAGNGHIAAAAASRTPEQQPAQAANGRPPQSCPLSLVVTDAVRRWYSDAHRDALKGDVVGSHPWCRHPFRCRRPLITTSAHPFSKLQIPGRRRRAHSHPANSDSVCSGLLQKQQALLGQMLLEGYGCDRDPAAGREWVDKAKRRGYRMEGVYCEL